MVTTPRDTEESETEEEDEDVASIQRLYHMLHGRNFTPLDVQNERDRQKQEKEDAKTMP